MESTNAKNARRRIAMRNGRRIKKMKEDIGTLRDILRDVCQRLTRMEKIERQRNEEQEEEFYSCEEISLEGKEAEEGMDEEERPQPKQEQYPPQPLDSSHSDTETNEAELKEEDTEETTMAKQQKWSFTWPLSRENSGPWSIGYVMNMKIIANEEIPKVGTEWKFCYPFSRDKPGPYSTDYVKARIEEEKKPSE
eukprot:TRINITY_DN1649_c0_g2_i2.p1 TRINITY_DN1649_c0_g2~~TRINITY_DN1649_c0_g2_i2.p1  ORF type:complete len:194 (+),score=44.66 TRINITY_DN1649_c0_g2_i2:247-828(+)